MSKCFSPCLSSLKNEQVNNHSECSTSAFKALVVLSSSPPLYVGRSFTSIWLFTPFEEQLRRVILLAILVTLPWLENFKPYMELAATQIYHSFLKDESPLSSFQLTHKIWKDCRAIGLSSSLKWPEVLSLLYILIFLDLRDHYTKRSSACFVRLVKSTENSSLLYYFILFWT